jgi:ATP-dependent Clp protease ATP-binding subunit ClpC
MLNAYARSRTSDPRGDGADGNIARRMNLHAAIVWRAGGSGSAASIHAIAAGLGRAGAGRLLLARLGISAKSYSATLTAFPDTTRAAADPLRLLTPLASQNREITSGDLLAVVFESETPLKALFLASGATVDDCRRAAAWVEDSLNKKDAQKRWWRRERLSAIPSIGARWAYGRTYYLDKFGREITGDTRESIVGRESELHLMESALARQSGANVLLVGDPGSGKKSLLGALAERIRRDVVAPPLTDKRLVIIDSADIIAHAKTKGDTEALLITIFDQAAAAGNIIIAMNAFPEFVASLSALGINAGQILSPYLESTSLHIVALADTAPFRRAISAHAEITNHFATVYLTAIDRDRLIAILENHVPVIEAAYHGRLVITYQAVRAAADAGINHITDGALPGRAIGLLEEAAASAEAAGVVTPDHIMKTVGEKTHLPMGVIAPGEKIVLQNIESELHRRVVGQDPAVSAIADAVRRTRTAVRNPRRPIASFLFLGPTGVGKTESAKALAATYFGDESRMIRFDMTEYQTEDDVKRLLGSSGGDESGLLAAGVRRTPYGILLLDEFEKSHPEIRNLFLQILDEGFFTNAAGDRILLRDMVIIATSNAGALLIQDMVGRGQDPSARKEELIRHIETEARLSPELLNRFDALIVFRPLDMPALRAIARIMLDALVVRLKEQNYIFMVTPGLVAACAEGGFDPQFGARPMRRWIQDHIEKAVSDGIIAGAIAPGAPFAIRPADFGIIPADIQ